MICPSTRVQQCVFQKLMPPWGSHNTSLTKHEIFAQQYKLYGGIMKHTSWYVMKWPITTSQWTSPGNRSTHRVNLGARCLAPGHLSKVRLVWDLNQQPSATIPLSKPSDHSYLLFDQHLLRKPICIIGSAIKPHVSPIIWVCDDVLWCNIYML